MRLSDNVDISEAFSLDNTDYKKIRIWYSEKFDNILKENKLTDSTSAARRLIQQGSVSVNGEKVSDVNQEFSGDQEVMVKVGKKRYLKIEAG